MNTYANIPLIEQISAALRDSLGEEFDAETFWDTLDGETNALDIADALLSQIQDAAAMELAIKQQIDQMSARKERFANREKATKAALLQLLDASGEKKLERPAATVSRRAGSLSVKITDETSVPSQLCKTTVAPDKTAIKKQLQAGEDVPGAELARGPDGVTVRFA